MQSNQNFSEKPALKKVNSGFFLKEDIVTLNKRLLIDEG